MSRLQLFEARLVVYSNFTSRPGILSSVNNIWISADRAKAIKTKAIVNESPTDKLIRELKEENARLMKELQAKGGVGGGQEAIMQGVPEEGECMLPQAIKAIDSYVAFCLGLSQSAYETQACCVI